MSDADNARAFGRRAVIEYGMPADRDQLVARLAYAYAAGSRDGYMEAADTASKAWGELIAESRDGYMEAADTASKAWGELIAELDEEKADK